MTEEVSSARALAEERLQLKLATEAAGTGIWNQDVPTKRMTYSSRARAIYGIPEGEELAPERIFSVIHPDDHARVATRAPLATRRFVVVSPTNIASSTRVA